MERVVLDTNVFVAAGFNRDSHAARIVEGLGRGEWRMVWNRTTRAETRAVLTRIPPLSWERVAPLFRPQDEFRGATDPGAYERVRDPAHLESYPVAWWVARSASVGLETVHLERFWRAKAFREWAERTPPEGVTPAAHAAAVERFVRGLSARARTYLGARDSGQGLASLRHEVMLLVLERSA